MSDGEGAEKPDSGAVECAEPRIPASLMHRRHLRRGLIILGIGVFCWAAILIGWIGAEWDASRLVGGPKRMPLWLASVWIGLFGAGAVAFGISQIRSAALFRPDNRGRRGPLPRDPE